MSVWPPCLPGLQPKPKPSPQLLRPVTIQLSPSNTFLGGAGNRKEAKGMVLNHQDHYKPATQG